MDYLHNTTFVVERSATEEFLTWVRTTYIPAAKHSGHFKEVNLVKILMEIDPDASNYAVQMRSTSLENARQWHNDVATILKDDISARMGERVVFFSTDMEVIE